MISFQYLQVCLAEERFLMSSFSRIFFKISGGKTWLIVGMSFLVILEVDVTEDSSRKCELLFMVVSCLN